MKSQHTHRCPRCRELGDVKDNFTGLLLYSCPNCSKEWLV